METLQTATAPIEPPLPQTTSFFLRRPVSYSFALCLAVVVPVMASKTASIGLSATGWPSLSDRIRASASVELVEEFSEDLRGWAGRGGWPGTWTFHRAGQVAPGQLAIYMKSVPLVDYHMEFFGTVERGGVSFVYRATDFDNYYAGRIIIVKEAPIPDVALERYAVINGQAGPKTRVLLPFSVRMDTLYDVRVEVEGDHFVTSINDQLVDAFRDSRLASGGVGFFGSPGESARICSLRLSHHDDLLGRVCSFFASILPADA